MLCGCSFLGSGSDIICIIFAKNGSEYDYYVTIMMNSTGIIYVASPKIVDALLTLIFMMRQRVCRLPFHLKRRPIVYLWQYGTMQDV